MNASLPQGNLLSTYHSHKHRIHLQLQVSSLSKITPNTSWPDFFIETKSLSRPSPTFSRMASRSRKSSASSQDILSTIALIKWWIHLRGPEAKWISHSWQVSSSIFETYCNVSNIWPLKGP